MITILLVAGILGTFYTVLCLIVWRAWANNRHEPTQSEIDAQFAEIVAELPDPGPYDWKVSDQW